MMSSQIFETAPLCSDLCRLEAQPRLQALLGPIPRPRTHSRGWGDLRLIAPQKLYQLLLPRAVPSAPG